MIIRNSDIYATAVAPSQYPETGLPEVAFAGRSNVGKSSLINSLVNRKALARTSSTPGKTRVINFFSVNEDLYLVDLPGYGYAKVAKDEKAKWGQMIDDYLNNREQLKLVILLVDVRHEPTKDDKIMYEWMKATGSQMVVVATKADKLTRNHRNKSLQLIRKSLEMSQDDILLPFSSQTKDGRDELWETIEKFSNLN
ncbi:MAG: ribosome biogenesis GTP-binding protein YihA/YsxC [Niameybacter sp.]